MTTLLLVKVDGKNSVTLFAIWVKRTLLLVSATLYDNSRLYLHLKEGSFFMWINLKRDKNATEMHELQREETQKCKKRKKALEIVPLSLTYLPN